MKTKLLLGLVMLFGVMASSVEAQPGRRVANAVAASRAQSGFGTYISGYGYYSCPFGSYPRYLNAGQNVWYDYRYGMYWTAYAPYPGVYCVR